jgi:hypothetical protein
VTSLTNDQGRFHTRIFDMVGVYERDPLPWSLWRMEGTLIIGNSYFLLQSSLHQLWGHQGDTEGRILLSRLCKHCHISGFY